MDEKISELQIKADQEGQASLIYQRGGKREGAGRKKSPYEQRKVSLALDPQHWKIIDNLKESEKMSQSDILRRMIANQLKLGIIGSLKGED